MPISGRLIKKAVCCMVEVGIRTSFSNFCYTFGGEVFHQQSGGPIGDRLTMIVAQYSQVEVWYRMDSMLTRSRCLMYTVDRQAVEEVDAYPGAQEYEGGKGKVVMARDPQGSNPDKQGNPLACENINT